MRLRAYVGSSGYPPAADTPLFFARRYCLTAIRVASRCFAARFASAMSLRSIRIRHLSYTPYDPSHVSLWRPMMTTFFRPNITHH